VMEPGPAPFVTDAGILLLYNGADDHLVYGPGWVLFDQSDPGRVLARSGQSFIAPVLDWERNGQVPNVIFLEGTVGQSLSKYTLSLTGYYGAADKYIGALQLKIVLRPLPTSE